MQGIRKRPPIEHCSDRTLIRIRSTYTSISAWGLLDWLQPHLYQVCHDIVPEKVFSVASSISRILQTPRTCHGRDSQASRHGTAYRPISVAVACALASSSPHLACSCVQKRALGPRASMLGSAFRNDLQQLVTELPIFYCVPVVQERALPLVPRRHNGMARQEPCS